MNESPETTTVPAGKRARFPKPVLFAGMGIVALVLIALVVAVALPNRPTDYQAGSPEAAFQDFYEAWQADDIEGAYGHLSTAVTKDLSLSEYRRLDTDWSWQRNQDRRLILLGADVTGDRATLHVRVDEFSDGGMGGIGGQRYSSERSVRLAREGGAWLIDEPLIGIEPAGYGY